LKRASAWSVAWLPAVLAGCNHDGKTVVIEPAEDLTLAEVVSRVNANNVPVNFGLKGRSAGVSVSWTERVTPNDERTHHLQADAVALLLKPTHMYIDLSHGFGKTVMQIGCNGERYWLWIEPEVDKLWWGKYEHLDKPCHKAMPIRAMPIRAMPIRPDQLFEALGVADLPFDTTGPAGPMLRVSGERNELLIVSIDEDDQHYIVKEYGVDRRPPYLIREVIHRDRDGRVLMHTTLGKYGPVRSGTGGTSGSMMAHEIHVEWPIRKATLDLEISEWMRLDAVDKDAPGFVFPLDEPDHDYREIEQVDQACER